MTTNERTSQKWEAFFHLKILTRYIYYRTGTTSMTKIYVDKCIILYKTNKSGTKTLFSAFGNINDIKVNCLKHEIQIPKTAYLRSVYGCFYVETVERYESDRRSYIGPFNL